MSIILDALRRGRGRQTPRPNSNAAHTDAVLQTLGYGRFSPASPFNRLKRFFGYLAAGIAFAIVLWGVVIWITQAYLTPDSTEVYNVPAASAGKPVAPTPAPSRATAPPSAAPVAPTPQPVTKPAPIAPPVTKPAPTAPVAAPVTKPALTAPVAQPVTKPAPSSAPAGKPAGKPNAPVARPAGRPSRATAPPATTAVTPPANQPIVHHSRRPDVPENVPTPPSGAPSRTALSASAGATTATVTTGDDHFRRAVIAQRLGDFENALFHYKQLLQRDDLNVQAHNNLGLVYRDKGLLDDAVREFQRAVAIEPGYSRARNNLGVAYLNQRKLDAAIAEFRAVLAIDPKNVESLVNLSTAEKEAGRRDDARSALVRALEIDPRNAEAHYNFGLLEDEAGNRERALIHYRAFLQHGAAGYPSLVGEVRKRIQKIESEK